MTIIKLGSTITLSILLAACGGSSGPESNGNNAGSTFSTPIDASTLRDTLITGFSNSDTSQSWSCALSDGSAMLTYRLFADGTGVELDTNNQNAQSSFIWQATSATSITTTVDNSGIQNSFSNIQFSDSNSMSLAVTENLSLVCERVISEPSVPGNSINGNALSYGGVVYELTHGFEEAFSYRPTQRGDTHRTSEFSVANAPFRSTTILSTDLSPTLVIWRPNNATIWMRANLHSPGGNRFTSATFEYEPNNTDENGPSVANRFFFNDGRLGVDVNQNESIDSEDNEFIDITAGTISVERLTGNNARMRFDVTLANGVNVKGAFEGLFILIDYD